MKYIILILVILVLVGLFNKFPKLILPLLICSVPLQRYSVYFSDIGLSVKLIMLVLPAVYFTLLVRRKKQFIFHSKRLIVCAVLLLLGILFSMLGSINHFRTFSVFAFSLLTLSYSYVLIILIRQIKDWDRAINLLVYIGTLVSFLGFYQFYLFSSDQEVLLPLENLFSSKSIEAEAFEFIVGNNSYLRPSSTFMDVNLTSGFLAVVVFVNIAILLKDIKTTKIINLKMLLLLFVNMVGFVLTVSRSGYLGLFCGGLIFTILNYKSFLNKNVLILFLGGVMIVILSIVFFDTPIESMWGRFQDTFFRHDITGSTQEHNLFSSAAFEIFKDNSVFGIGAGNFEEYYLTRIDPEEDTAYTYNVYLGFLSETGIVGFGGQMLFIIYVIYSSIKSLLEIRNDELKLTYSALLCGFVSILIANIFYSYYILFFVWLVIGFLLAFSENELYKYEEKN